MYHINSSSIFVFIAKFSLCFLFISCASQTFESQSETDFLPYVHSPAGVLRIPSDRDDRMGGGGGGGKKSPQKSRGFQTKLKKSHGEFPSHKNFQKAEQVWFYWAYAGTITI